MDEMAWGIIMAGLTLFGIFGLAISSHGQTAPAFSALKVSLGKKAA